MDDFSQTVMVSAYRDPEHQDLVWETPIIDGGMFSGGDRSPTSDDTLIYMAKQTFRSSGEDVDALHWEVKRVREWGPKA